MPNALQLQGYFLPDNRHVQGGFFDSILMEKLPSKCIYFTKHLEFPEIEASRFKRTENSQTGFSTKILSTCTCTCIRTTPSGFNLITCPTEYKAKSLIEPCSYRTYGIVEYVYSSKISYLAKEKVSAKLLTTV